MVRMRRQEIGRGEVDKAEATDMKGERKGWEKTSDEEELRGIN